VGLFASQKYFFADAHRYFDSASLHRGIISLRSVTSEPADSGQMAPESRLFTTRPG